jgi:hypothetical protein
MTKLILITNQPPYTRLTRYIGTQAQEVALLEIKEGEAAADVRAFVEEMRAFGLPNDPVQA